MINPALFKARLLAMFGLFFLVSCAPKVTFFVTKPPRLPIEDIESISIGEFKDVLKQNITPPTGFKDGKLKKLSTFSPRVSTFSSNQSTADLVRAMVVAKLSTSNQYRILNTGGADVTFSGIVPDAKKTGIVSAKVRYFKQFFEGSETRFFTLLATKNGGTLQEQLAMLAARETSSAIASRSKKGFSVPVPYVEVVSALEVEFDLIRDSTGQPIVPTQVFQSYYLKKWGGTSDKSHLVEPIRSVIVTQFFKKESVMESLTAQLSEIKKTFLDRNDFLAMGGKLKYDPSVPETPLEIRTRLVQDVVDQFVKQISQFTIETTMKIASGDKRAVTYIKANAYELAINRLENIERSEADSFNLALAYESIAEFRQAGIYYQEALDKNPGNKTYQQAISRVGQ